MLVRDVECSGVVKEMWEAAIMIRLPWSLSQGLNFKIKVVVMNNYPSRLLHLTSVTKKQNKRKQVAKRLLSLWSMFSIQLQIPTDCPLFVSRLDCLVKKNRHLTGRYPRRNWKKDKDSSVLIQSKMISLLYKKKTKHSCWESKHVALFCSSFLVVEPNT